MKEIKLLSNIPQRVYFVFFPLFLVGVLILFFLISLSLNFWINQNTVKKVPFAVSPEAKLPIIKTKFVPDITAQGSIIMDADSNVVLYSKNPDLRFSTASTIKIMTALVALDHFKLSDVLNVYDFAFEGSVLGLFQGEQMSFENLLYAMLLPSANDAAITIAENYPGGEKAFVEKMNEKAKLLKLYNTHYSDPAGLADSGDYTTPFDLARLASLSIKNPEFRQIVGTKEKVITDITGASVYDIKNLNILLGTDGVNGIKTGYTEEAGQVLVTSKVEKGKTLIIVVMGSTDRFEDTAKLLNLITNNVTYLSIHP